MIENETDVERAIRKDSYITAICQWSVVIAVIFLLGLFVKGLWCLL